MQELIVTILLAILTGAAGILLAAGYRTGSGMTKRQRRMLGRILAASFLLLVLQLIPESAFDAWDALLPGLGWGLHLALYLADYWIIGHDILKKAWKGIRNHQVFDECFLMAVATAVSYTHLTLPTIVHV